MGEITEKSHVVLQFSHIPRRSRRRHRTRRIRSVDRHGSGRVDPRTVRRRSARPNFIRAFQAESAHHHDNACTGHLLDVVEQQVSFAKCATSAVSVLHVPASAKKRPAANQRDQIDLLVAYTTGKRTENEPPAITIDLLIDSVFNLDADYQRNDTGIDRRLLPHQFSPATGEYRRVDSGRAKKGRQKDRSEANLLYGT